MESLGCWKVQKIVQGRLEDFKLFRMVEYKMEKIQYTNAELQMFEKLMEELVVWMFYQPNSSHPILEIIKKAYNEGRDRKE